MGLHDHVMTDRLLCTACIALHCMQLLNGHLLLLLLLFPQRASITRAPLEQRRHPFLLDKPWLMPRLQVSAATSNLHCSSVLMFKPWHDAS